MTDRINSFIVVLDKDRRNDDCEFILNAIRMIKGVTAVTENITDHSYVVAEMRAKSNLRDKLYELIKNL